MRSSGSEFRASVSLSRSSGAPSAAGSAPSPDAAPFFARVGVGGVSGRRDAPDAFAARLAGALAAASALFALAARAAVLATRLTAAAAFEAVRLAGDTGDTGGTEDVAVPPAGSSVAWLTFVGATTPFRSCLTRCARAYATAGSVIGECRRLRPPGALPRSGRGHCGHCNDTDGPPGAQRPELRAP